MTVLEWMKQLTPVDYLTFQKLIEAGEFNKDRNFLSTKIVNHYAIPTTLIDGKNVLINYNDWLESEVVDLNEIY